MAQPGEFADRTVLVTGAAHGLGRGIALAFAAARARVWGCDVNQESLAETATLAGGRIETRRVDVTGTFLCTAAPGSRSP
jgi:3-oxoacyl-[acyl-carrier protein] reductase